MSGPSSSNPAHVERTRREILSRSDLIPPLPQHVVRLLELLSTPDTDPRDVEALLQRDLVLVAKMLAMANSPFYGLYRKVKTIREAVMVLGFRDLRSLILVTSTSKFLQRDYTCYGHDDNGLWVHSAAVAAGARSLARSCGMGAERAEQLFVAGLLHDIGKLLLVSYLSQRTFTPDTHHRITDKLERTAIGIDHTEAGGLVAAKWHLSEELQEVLKGHHDSEVAADHAQPVAVVRLADALAHENGIGYLQGHAPKAVYLPCDLDLLGLDEHGWRKARDEMTTGVEDAVACMRLLA